MKISKVFFKNLIKNKNSKKTTYTGIIKTILKKDDNYTTVSFNDGKKSRFPNKYNDFLKTGSKIKFTCTLNKNWVNPVKNLYIDTIYESKKEYKGKSENITGVLSIGYVSKIKKDSKGEYLYLPNCSFANDSIKIDNIPSILYINDIDQKIESKDIFTGYGKITGSFVKQGNVVNIKNINSFKPAIKKMNQEFSLSEVFFENKYLRYQSGKKVFYCDQNNVPFKFPPIDDITNSYNEIPSSIKKLKKNLSDQFVKIKIIQRKTGTVKKVDNKWKENIKWEVWSDENDSKNWDFSNCNIEIIENELKIFNMEFKEYNKEQKIAHEYGKLLYKIKYSNEIISINNIKKRVEKIGKKISNKEIYAMFFHPGYNKEIFNLIEKKSLNIYVYKITFSKRSYIFKIKTNSDKVLYVWETPIRTQATYIFNDSLSAKQLFARLKETPRKIIRENKEIQDSLGFEGFIIHTNYNFWVDKFNLFLK